jgi:hypothetical protein
MLRVSQVIGGESATLGPAAFEHHAAQCPEDVGVRYLGVGDRQEGNEGGWQGRGRPRPPVAEHRAIVVAILVPDGHGLPRCGPLKARRRSLGKKSASIECHAI